MRIEKIQKTDSYSRFLLLLVFFGFLLWISYQFVPTGDDWNRIVFSNRTPEGFLKLISDHYRTLNGRVVGNFLSYWLIDPWARALAKVFAILLLTILLADLSRIKGPLAFFTAFFFVMTVPRLIFVQVYPWTAGFYNYVPPMIGVLWLFADIQPLFAAQPLTGGKRKTAAWFVAGIVLCLFVEHITLFLLFLSAGLIVYQLIAYKKAAPFTIGLLLGVIIGTTIMFASPIYREILFAGDSYRTVPESASHFIDILVQNYRSFSRYILLESPVFLLLVCALCAYTLIRLHTGLMRKPVTVWFLILPVYAGLTRLLFSSTFNFTPDVMRAARYLPLWVDAGVHLITFAAILYTGSAIRHLPTKRQYRFVLLCIPVLVAPLFVVRPVLARNYYASYLFLAIAMLLLIKQLLRTKKLALHKMAVLLPVLCAGIVLFYGVVYTLNQNTFRHRIRVIESAMERHEDPIIIPDFPVPYFVFGPGDSSLGHAFYYEKANDIEFILQSEYQ